MQVNHILYRKVFGSANTFNQHVSSKGHNPWHSMRGRVYFELDAKVCSRRENRLSGRIRSTLVFRLCHWGLAAMPEGASIAG